MRLESELHTQKYTAICCHLTVLDHDIVPGHNIWEGSPGGLSWTTSMVQLCCKWLCQLIIPKACQLTVIIANLVQMQISSLVWGFLL